MACASVYAPAGGDRADAARARDDGGAGFAAQQKPGHYGGAGRAQNAGGGAHSGGHGFAEQSDGVDRPPPQQHSRIAQPRPSRIPRGGGGGAPSHHDVPPVAGRDGRPEQAQRGQARRKPQEITCKASGGFTGFCVLLWLHEIVGCCRTEISYLWLVVFASSWGRSADLGWGTLHV